MSTQQVSKVYKNIEILFENNDFIVVNKPHGINVIKGRNRFDDIILYDALLAMYKKLYLVHRLDASAGGLMVFAKNKRFCSYLTEQFEKHRVIKKYLCLCDGILEVPITIMLPISKRNYRGAYKINFRSGKKSVTSFFPIGHNAGKSIVLAMPLTGRTHQIRLHLKSIKLPITGDYIYNKVCQAEGDKKIPLYAFYLQFDNFVFKVKPSDYFISLASKYNIEDVLYQFFDKTL